VNAPTRTHVTFVATGLDVALSEPMDVDPGWSTQGLWAFGSPAGGGGEYGGPDPDSGYTGPNVYGYNLSGDYENNLPERHLTSSAIDCSQLVGTTLRFQRWLGVEQPAYDHAYVRVSVNGTNWTTVWSNDAEITDGAWSLQEFDISAIADGQPTVYLRWTMGTTDVGWRYCGWNIDDVEVFGLSCDDGCPADVDGSGTVDVVDLLAVLAAWGDDGVPEDVNGDGVVDVLDLLDVLAAWGPC
jgi:hypothetical protein